MIKYRKEVIVPLTFDISTSDMKKWIKDTFIDIEEKHNDVFGVYPEDVLDVINKLRSKEIEYPKGIDTDVYNHYPFLSFLEEMITDTESEKVYFILEDE